MKVFTIALFSLFFSPLMAQEYCPEIDLSCPGGKTYPLHLTFDDGPRRETPHILEILREHDVKATFFLQGEYIVTSDGKKMKSKSRETLMKKMLAEGHILGSHTYHHIHHLDQALGVKLKDIDIQMLAKSHLNWKTNISTQKDSPVLQPYMVNQGKMYIRLPYGQGWFRSKPHTNPDTVVLKEALGESKNGAEALHVGWNISPDDWENPPPEEYLKRLKTQICREKGGVILLHDFTKATNQTLSCFLQRAKEAGHDFVDSPDYFRERKESAYIAKVVMAYEDIPGVELPPEKNCDDDEKKGSLEKLSDQLVEVDAEIRRSSDYTPTEKSDDLESIF